MKRFYISFLISIVALLSTVSCTHNLMQPWPPDAARQEEDIWNYYYYCLGTVDILYADYIFCPYPNEVYDSGDDVAMLACASDEAEHSLASSSVQRFTDGSWGPSNTPELLYGGSDFHRTDRTPWLNSYSGMRAANQALHKLGKSVLIDDLEDPTKRYDLTWALGQIYFWRAWFEFDLLRHYGPFVITTDIEEVGDEMYRGRNTMDECVQQILSDLDSAIEKLPLLWDETNWFRVNVTCAQAVKSRLLLYYASPLYQGDFETFGLAKGEVGDVQRWKDCIAATRAAINDNDFYYMKTVTNFDAPLSAEGTYNYVIHFAANLDNTEIIFSTNRYGGYTFQYKWETFNMPAGIDYCHGLTNPTQEMVDQFEVVTGKGNKRKAVPFDWSDTSMANHPYDNRDPRFYCDILHDGMYWWAAYDKSYHAEMHESVTIDGVTYPGGKHRDKTLKETTKTGYYYRKFLSEEFGNGASNRYNMNLKRQRHEIRIAELLLNYAEAMNEVYGPEGEDPDGELRDCCASAHISTARAAVNAVRNRVKMPLIPTGLTQEEMREVIHHERCVELCFEGHRMFDLRRWKEGETLGKPIHGIEIYPTAFDDNGKPLPDSKKYVVKKIEDRVWHDCYYWWPIPLKEVVKYENHALKQNPQWE